MQFLSLFCIVFTNAIGVLCINIESKYELLYFCGSITRGGWTRLMYFAN